MKLPSSAIAALCSAGIFLGSSLPSAVAADRNIDTNVIYPNAALVQNGGRVINMMSPPSGIRAAVGNGTTDDTAAFQDAFDFIKNQFVASTSNSYIIYVPNGTYRITATLIYRGSVVSGLDLNNVRIVGQSRAGVTFKLDNNLAAFQSATSPAPLLAFQHPSTTFNNIATSNLCENITLNTGSGNPGAAAIHFQGANSARMSNVTITSADGGGRCGVWLKTGSVQAYLKDITINGFQYGILSVPNAENDSAWEHVSMNNQTLAGIYIQGGGISMRDLDFNQSTAHVPAVQFTATGGSCVLLDSHLNGGSSTNPAVVITSPKQDFFARNVSVSGYTVAVQNQGVTAVAAPYVSEYVALPTTTLFTVPDMHSFALPVEDTPIVGWETNMGNWVNVHDFGATGNGTTDDTAAIQAAFNSAGTNGQTSVYFPGLSYLISSAITIPASVNRVDFMFSKITGGSFSINAASPNPVILVGKAGYTTTNIAAARTVIAEFHSGNLVNQQSAPIHTFVESCTNMGGGGSFCSAGQSLWARSLNDENGSGTDIVGNGGTLWILGYKTENKPCIALEGEGGGYVEVLGGYTNCVQDPGTTPMIKNVSANVCYTGFTNMTGTFPTVISETQGTTTVTAANTAFPPRGGTYASNFFVPLYLSGARPSTSLGIFTQSEDIGAVGATGSASSYAGKYFIDGSGADIYNTADAFQFVNTTETGNATFVARINSIDNTNEFAKAGVMFRDSLNANGMFVAMLMTAGNGVRLETRTAVGATASIAASNTSLTLPCWVKLQRTAASSFTGYTSPDGTTWTQLGTATVNLPSAAQAGLCVTAHNTGAVCRTIIENVFLSQTSLKFEAESLPVTAYSGPDWRIFTDTLCSGSEGSILDSNAAGNYFTFTVPAITQGTYDVRVGVKKLNTRGIAQMGIGAAGGTIFNQGAAQDLYSATATYPELDLGTWSPAASSDKWFRFTITGKNASSSGYSEAIDYIRLIAQ